MNTLQKDQQFLGRDVKPFPLQITKSDGSYLYDEKGKKYIDFVMGWCVGNIGWGQEEIKKEIHKFLGPEYVLPGIPGYLYEPWAKLAELLAEITPGKLTKSFRATGGTESVEIALQAAMSHTKRSKFISIEGAYHGHSIGTMSVGSSNFRKWYTNLLPDCYKIEPPLNEKAAEKIEALLKTKEIAAYISEPIVINASVEVPAKEYYERVYKACKKYGTVFIMDEVASGFGRTGKLFASEYYHLEPDIMCLGKGITGGYGAMGATIMTEELAKSFAFEFSFYSTFGWHPLNAVATLANVTYLVKHKDQILKNVNEMSKYFKTRFEAMSFSFPVDIRMKGLAIALEFQEVGYIDKIVTKAMTNGLLMHPDPQTLMIFPNLNIDKKTAKEGLDILEQSL